MTALKHLRTLVLLLAPVVAVGPVLPVSPAAAAGARTVLVSVTSQEQQVAGPHPDGSSVSDDGRFVAFRTPVPLSATDGNGKDDVYVRDRRTGTTVWASQIPPGGSRRGGVAGDAVMSGNGRYVVFASRDGLVPDPSAAIHLYRRDLVDGSVRLVDVEPDGSGQRQRLDERYAVSTNGRYVAYNTDPGGKRGAITIRDMQSNASEKVPGVFYYLVDLSADGRKVLYRSEYAPDFSHDDTDNLWVRDLDTGGATRENLATTGAEPEYGSSLVDGRISGDGRYVAFLSDSSVLAPGAPDLPKRQRVLLRDRSAGTTAVVSERLAQHVDISADGRSVAYERVGEVFTPVVVRDLRTGVEEVVSVDTRRRRGDAPSSAPAISADGRFVSFSTRSVLSDDDVLHPGGDGENDVYLRDRGV